MTKVCSYFCSHIWTVAGQSEFKPQRHQASTFIQVSSIKIPTLLFSYKDTEQLIRFPHREWSSVIYLTETKQSVSLLGISSILFSASATKAPSAQFTTSGRLTWLWVFQFVFWLNINTGISFSTLSALNTQLSHYMSWNTWQTEIRSALDIIPAHTHKNSTGEHILVQAPTSAYGTVSGL